MKAPYTPPRSGAREIIVQKSHGDTTQDFAIKYATEGWPVFQVWGIAQNGVGLTCKCRDEAQCKSPGKHPIRKGWQDIATKNIEKIRSWNWEGKNIGIATGKISGLYVIDIDSKDDGMESLKRWEKHHGPLCPKYRVLTGSGGYHYFMPYPSGQHGGHRGGNSSSGPFINRSGILHSVDVRGDGGFVVAPPSLHISGGTYEWEL